MGLNVERIRKDVENIGWPEKDFLTCLTLGFGDYEVLTPTVCTEYPHQMSARKDQDELFSTVDKEIESEWLRPTAQLPKTGTFGVIHGNIVPKNDGEDGPRIVWDAFWPITNSQAGVVKEFERRLDSFVPEGPCNFY